MIRCRALRPFHPFTRKAIGCYLLLAGAASIVWLLDAGVKSHGALSLLLAWGIPVVVYGSMVLSGILILREKRIGLWLACIVLFLQMPFISIGKLAWTVSAYPSVEMKLWPLLGFAFSTNPSFVMLWADDARATYVGFNVVAIVFLWAIAAFFDEPTSAPDSGDLVNESG